MLAGCSATVAAGEADSEASTVTALVVVERTASEHSEAHARFIRAAANDEGALDLVAGAESLPAIGACSAGSAAIASKPVALMDVGAVTVDANDVRTTLVARRLPDVVSLVSGVVYTARGPEDGSFGAGRYVLRVAGSPELHAFTREADAPALLTAIRVDGQAASGPVDVGAAADVTWEPGVEGDVVVIDAPTAGGTQRCAFADDAGRAHVTNLAPSGVLTLHRVRQAPIAAPGVDRGELRFDFSRVVVFRRR